MEVIITGRHMTVHEDLKKYIADKMQKLGDDYPKMDSLRITLDCERSACVVEGHLHGKHLTIDAKDKDADARAAFDAVYHKLSRKLHKYLEKVHDHHRKFGRQASEEQKAGFLDEAIMEIRKEAK